MKTLMGVYARPRRNPTKATIKVEGKVETRFLEVKLSFRCALPRNYPTNDGPSTETLKTYFSRQCIFMHFITLSKVY